MDDLPTILFVDDEPHILKSLRRRFMEEDWHMLFAESGAEGLEILKSESVDLIISDVRMPGMDGIEFFTRVKALYPDTARIFLSGYAEKEGVIRALAQGCVHQILPKPWDDEELREVVQLTLKQRCSDEGQRLLQILLSSLNSLPPFPSVYQELKECLADRDRFTVDQVVEIVRGDAALSADLLRYANSSLFGQRRQVETVKKAIVLLGIDIVESLVFSEAAYRSFGPLLQKKGGLDRLSFQRHSMGCAMIAMLLAKSFTPDKPKQADRAFIAGLLHDIGLLAEASMFPEQFVEVRETVSTEKIPLIEAETRILRTSHPEVGAVLAEWWSLPSFIVNVIRRHAMPGQAGEDEEIVIKVALANIIANDFGFGIDGDDTCPPVTEQRLRAEFPLASEQIELIRQKCEESLAAIV